MARRTLQCKKLVEIDDTMTVARQSSFQTGKRKMSASDARGKCLDMDFKPGRSEYSGVGGGALLEGAARGSKQSDAVASDDDNSDAQPVAKKRRVAPSSLDMASPTKLMEALSQTSAQPRKTSDKAS